MRTLFTTLHSKYIHPSLALPYLMGHARKKLGKRLELRHREFTVHEPAANVLAEIVAEQPQVAAFSVYLWNRRETLELCANLKRIDPGIFLILGGPEVSFEAESFFIENPSVDAIVRGEGEAPLTALLQALLEGTLGAPVAGVTYRLDEKLLAGDTARPLKDLDRIPSPFAEGTARMDRGYVYLETSRGCPYRCIFCMSALDASVRSFSMARIRADLDRLMKAEVPQIKVVDRTFNYDPKRAREIFRYILDHNRCSRFHFEIGAQLLDEPTLALLEEVPAGTFQFEIGVQSTLPPTLELIDRHCDLNRLWGNIEALRRRTAVHLHLDLIAGLPGETEEDVLGSVDRVLALTPHELQLETVKVLPGSPLRQKAAEQGIVFSPAPPYSALRTAQMSFGSLERLRRISRLLDMLYNGGSFRHFLREGEEQKGSISSFLIDIEAFFSQEELFRHPLSRRELFEHLGRFCLRTSRPASIRLQDALSRDWACCEKLQPKRLPEFFPAPLSSGELKRLRPQVDVHLRKKTETGARQSWMLVRYRSSAPDAENPLFLYLHTYVSGKPPTISEIPIVS